MASTRMLPLEIRVARSPGAPLLPVKGSLTWVYRLSALVAVLLAITSVGGLIFGPRGLYQSDPFLLTVFLGQDAVSLVVGLPLLLGALWLTRRGSLHGLLLWSGALFYVAYSYFFYVVGVQFGPLFLAHIALVSASGYALLILLSRLDAEAIRARFGPELPVRLIGGFMVVAGVLFAAMWIGDVIRRLAAGEPLGEVQRFVYVADLTVALPAMVAVGVGLWRRLSWGYALAGLLLIKVVTLMLTLTANSAFLLQQGVPVTLGEVAPYALTLGVALACTILYLRAIRGSR